jgi:hypothetical protein
LIILKIFLEYQEHLFLEILKIIIIIIIMKNQIKVLYNIPCNPETNPIELLFGSLKRIIKTNNSKSLQNIKKSIEKYIKQIKIESLKNIFIKALTEK